MYVTFPPPVAFISVKQISVKEKLYNQNNKIKTITFLKTARGHVHPKFFKKYLQRCCSDSAQLAVLQPLWQQITQKQQSIKLVASIALLITFSVKRRKKIKISKWLLVDLNFELIKQLSLS